MQHLPLQYATVVNMFDNKDDGRVLDNVLIALAVIAILAYHFYNA